MSAHLWMILCLTYLAGLFSAGLLSGSPSALIWLCFIGSWLVIAAIASVVIPRYWRRGPRGYLWLLMGAVAILSAFYSHWRIPQPGAKDISQLLRAPHYDSRVVSITGRLLDGGQTNASGLQQYWLQTELIQVPPDPQFRPSSGQVYLTLPADLGTSWLGCEQIRVTGLLYQPKSPQNPSNFNFKAYLASRGVFAGVRGSEAVEVKKGFCLIPQLRQKIVRAQSQFLPKTQEGVSWEGLLLSSIVLGQKAANLPYELRSLFSFVGLSHLLAASGYQVSLLVGTVLSLSQWRSPRVRLSLGAGILFFYLGLTGLQPSVVRAGLMWLGIMIAVVSERKIKPLSALLFVATMMPLVNPIWIWDLGFQLSFLATFGILVTTARLQAYLDFLPPKLSEMVAVPLSATLWTTPLLLGQFSVFVLVAIPLNILVTPLIEIISLTGMISAIAALVFPWAGAAIAWLLYYPTLALIRLAEAFSQFPPLAVGQLLPGFVLLTYGIMVLVWLNAHWRPYWPALGLGLCGLILVPLLYQQFSRTQVTIFHTPRQPVILIQQPGNAMVISDGEAKTQQFLLAPMLAKSGISQVNCTLELKDPQNPPSLSDCSKLTWLEKSPPILDLTLANQHWWIFLQPPIANQVIPPSLTAQSPDVMLWAGKFFPQLWLETLKPKTVIAVAHSIGPSLRRTLKREGTRLWITGDEGAMQWTPSQGFFPETNLDYDAGR